MPDRESRPQLAQHAAVRIPAHDFGFQRRGVFLIPQGSGPLDLAGHDGAAGLLRGVSDDEYKRRGDLAQEERGDFHLPRAGENDEYDPDGETGRTLHDRLCLGRLGERGQTEDTNI